ncbi:hypothetical protein DRQ15_06375 [candidate division KSB1 bacterium]|nr:MAG: hypothetical protein B5M50_02475 [candidate division KSB1 bacterium 4484_219]RKY79173.1 MAG: hypothetical protein DRQ12_04380 [candidate division KSB1 bacterium]HDI51379.1 Ppx/GppA family phosphatase [Bacteroidota bacterium]RKY84720.1 MAG: hypothetical protein DRP98_04305 [candidate division KSB1 bacterium]RKY87533.1 MAG: hypothetical protein DRQ11_05980 [candidate division KSB1 bacterium]
MDMSGDLSKKLKQHAGQRFAAIDIGTNTILLLIAEVSPEGYLYDIYQEQAIPRLGRGINDTGKISPQAAAQAIRILESYKQKCAECGVNRIFIVGTAALRTAKNAQQLLEQITSRLGLEIEIIPGEQEARFAFWGALSNKKNLPGQILVVDIGGGSTELIWGKAEEFENAISLKFGSVWLTERFIRSDPVTDDEVSELEAYVATQLRCYRSQLPHQVDVIVGTAGTVTTLAAMAQKLITYDPHRIDGFELTSTELLNQISEIKKRTLIERLRLPALEPNRADVILAGALILHQILKTWNKKSLLVSDRGLRFGVIIHKLLTT